MSLKKMVEYLNKHGSLAEGHIMMKLKVTNDEARKILKKIVNQYRNVYFIRNYLIVIKGCEESWMFLNNAQKKVIRSKWKNVTKP